MILFDENGDKLERLLSIALDIETLCTATGAFAQASIMPVIASDYFTDMQPLSPAKDQVAAGCNPLF